METVNRKRMCLALYPKLLEAKKTKSLSEKEIYNVVCSSAEGYAFPSNLDFDHPSPDDVAPKSQARYLLEALDQQWTF